MRTLLRHIGSGQYFKDLERWTEDVEDAHDFKRVDTALNFSRKAGFKDMELILSMDESEPLPNTSVTEFLHHPPAACATKRAHASRRGRKRCRTTGCK